MTSAGRFEGRFAGSPWSDFFLLICASLPRPDYSAVLDGPQGVGYVSVLPRRRPKGGTIYNGGVAQLGERVNGIHEVRGSIPLASIQAGRR